MAACTFICGLDLGQANDASALIITERHEPAPAHEAGTMQARATFDVRHIERFAIGTPYPAIVDRVVDRFREIRQGNDAWLIVDGTGVGRPVVDLFRQQIGHGLLPITIHGGDAVTEDDQGYVRVPKRDLAGVVQVLLQSKRLRFAARLPDVQLLTKELLNFKVKIDMRTAHDSYGEWRAGQHDDLVLALALTVWYGERMYSPGIFF